MNVDPGTVAVVISGAAFVLSAGRTIFGGGYGLGRKLETMRTELLAALATQKEEIEERQDLGTKAVGDGLAAIRELCNQQEQRNLQRYMEMAERISSFEKWARDEFVRKGSFERVVADMREVMNQSAARVERGLDQMRQVFMEHIAARGGDKS